MAPDNKSKKRKNYLPFNKSVKKGAYPLRPGVEGFFITCDGGREHQASHEAMDVIDSFLEELLEGKGLNIGQAELPKKPVNKVTKFDYSDSSSSENDDAKDGDVATGEVESKNVIAKDGDVSEKPGVEIKEDMSLEKQTPEEKEKPAEIQEAEAVEPPVKKQCVEVDAPKCGIVSKKAEDKSIDKLIEAELAELGDKSKRRFNKLDTGCSGVAFIQMRKRDGDPTPKEIVHHMISSLALSKKHVSRFMLRVLPVEASCYTSEEDIQRAIKPLIEKYFPIETEVPRKFAVLYDARANTGVDRAKVITAVAKSVPSVHKVDLSNPDINIMVQVVKTVCLIGVVEKYKEFSKYNLRQLSSPDQ